MKSTCQFLKYSMLKKFQSIKPCNELSRMKLTQMGLRHILGSRMARIVLRWMRSCLRKMEILQRSLIQRVEKTKLFHLSPSAFVSDLDSDLHDKNVSEYNNCTTQLFETNDSQGHSNDNKIVSYQVIKKDGNTVSEIEKYAQLNQRGMDKAISCTLNLHVVISFDLGKPMGLRKFLKEEHNGQCDKNIFHLGIFKSHTLLIKLFRRFLRLFIAKGSCHHINNIA